MAHHGIRKIKRPFKKSPTFEQDLERLSVEEMSNTFRKLYVPPLGPLDDPPGVIYLDEKLIEKTVDTRILESVGEGVREARKELFVLGTQRHSLVEEMRAQNRRVTRSQGAHIVNILATWCNLHMLHAHSWTYVTFYRVSSFSLLGDRCKLLRKHLRDPLVRVWIIRLEEITLSSTRRSSKFSLYLMSACC